MAFVVATGGALVRVAEPDVETLLERPGLQCVAVDPRRPGRIAAGCRGAGLWTTDDAGATWSDAELPGEDVFSVAFSPKGDRLVTASGDNTLLIWTVDH